MPFDAVFGRWMLNASFPRLGAGHALVERELFSVERWGFFFVPPDSEVPIGVVMLKTAPETRKTKTGRGCRPQDGPGRVWHSLARRSGGFIFQITTRDEYRSVLSDETDVGEYTLTELPPQPPQPQMDSAPPQDFTLKSAHEVLRVENRLPSGAGPYGG